MPTPDLDSSTEIDPVFIRFKEAEISGKCPGKWNMGDFFFMERAVCGLYNPARHDPWKSTQLN
jgi:hypothetical protein